jgi:nitrogen regulatory protein PII
MKMVMAVIKPFKLEDVQDALNDLDIQGMTVTEVTGYGKQKGDAVAQEKPSAQKTIGRPKFLPKLKIEMALSDEDTPRAVEAIKTAANTGRIGDGKVFVYDLNSAVRIRTGEENEQAI